MSVRNGYESITSVFGTELWDFHHNSKIYYNDGDDNGNNDSNNNANDTIDNDMMIY